MKRALSILLIIFSINSFAQDTPKIFVFETGKEVDFSDKEHLLSIKEVVIDVKWYGFEPITYLPEELEQLVNVEYVSFKAKYDANINDIFDKLIRLKKLKELVIEGNNFNMSNNIEPSKCDCITTIPETINKIVNLERLTLSGNLISHLPFIEGKMQNLKVINLFRNKFSKFPAELLGIPSLKEIGLENNDIIELPNLICEMQNLQVLSVGRNYLKSIPKCILKMKNIKEVGLNENYFTQKKLDNYNVIIPHGELPLLIITDQYNLEHYPKIDKSAKEFKKNSN